jgi:biotin carboxyl carrier protein
VNDTGETSVYLSVDHHQSVFSFPAERVSEGVDQKMLLTKEEVLALAKAGDIRAPFAATVVELSVKEGQEIIAGDRVALMEAMKMQTPVLSETSGIVTAIYASRGEKTGCGRQDTQNRRRSGGVIWFQTPANGTYVPWIRLQGIGYRYISRFLVFFFFGQKIIVKALTQ